MAFRRKQQPKTGATFTTVGVLYEQEDGKISGFFLDGLYCLVMENSFKKEDKHPDYNIRACLKRDVDPDEACRKAFDGLEKAFQELGVNVDRALEATSGDAKSDDVPF
jgi:hypothetical protein